MIMKPKTIILSLLAAVALSLGAVPAEGRQGQGLKDAAGGKMLVGVALNSRQVSGRDTSAVAVIRRHFNSIVAENCMKSAHIHPAEGRYDFREADAFVDFGEREGMAVIGHCLVWHSQLAPWFCNDSLGRKVSAEVLKRRMKEHISTVVGRYRGRVKGWDVVNEAIMDDGSYRNTPFYEILGEEYIALAFEYAHAADPEAELYYNDYGMAGKPKREAVVRMVEGLKRRGLRIDAIGMQAHMGMDYPGIADFERSIDAFAATGCKVMVTEWDMSALPTASQSANVADTAGYEARLNPYPGGLPDSVSRAWNRRMMAFFRLFQRHPAVTRVTVWGLADGDSWKNNFPVSGRTDYPLLFDRSLRPKPFVRELVAPKQARFASFAYSAPGDAYADTSAIANPILPGCYPDPSICRVGNDYYLVNSSFAFFPAVPIWHSTDLRSWRRLGYVLNRPSQLRLGEGLRISGGIYAPDIKYNQHNKLFYLITTDVDGRGTFFVTTDDPKRGSWSDPVFLPGVGGIDPSLFFDDDGKAYLLNNDAPAGKPLYDGHRAIWIREFDWKRGCTVGEQRVAVDGGVDITARPSWIEGPHLYRVGGKYYLMAAEGGTGNWHSEVVFVADSPMGPFAPCPVNPILTQRGLPEGRPKAVTCAGHADLVQLPDGQWRAVFLAVRPYKDGHDVMGRETFMLPVEWRGGQPVILPHGEALSYADRPVEPTPLWTAGGLAPDAFFIRTPQAGFCTTDPDGSLVLTAGSVGLADMGQPSAVGRWVAHFEFEACTTLDFVPQADGDAAGLMLFHDDNSFVSLAKVIGSDGGPCLRLTARRKGKTALCCTVALKAGDAGRELRLRVWGERNRATGAVAYRFCYAPAGSDEWTPVGDPVPADWLSTRTAGGFTGTMVGVFATGCY